MFINPLTPNDHYSGRTAPQNSKSCILYIYSTNIGTEYFKHDIYSPFFSLQNAVCFIILTYLVPVLFTFYIQCVVKLKNKSGAKRLSTPSWWRMEKFNLWLFSSLALGGEEWSTSLCGHFLCGVSAGSTRQQDVQLASEPDGNITRIPRIPAHNFVSTPATLSRHTLY